MKRHRHGGRWFTLLVNLLLNFSGSIPAWILLVLHFVCDLSLIWFFAALTAWVLWILFWMKVAGWATRMGNIPDPPKENKNPYSKH